MPATDMFGLRANLPSIGNYERAFLRALTVPIAKSLLHGYGSSSADGRARSTISDRCWGGALHDAFPFISAKWKSNGFAVKFPRIRAICTTEYDLSA